MKMAKLPVILALLASCTVGGGSGSNDAGEGVDASAASNDASGESIDSGVVILPDATSPSPDAGFFGICNPVTQAGCSIGEKCAQVVQSDNPFLAQTTCVPNGNVSEGGACTQGEAGATGLDDCLAGLDCLGGICSPICNVGPPDSCRSGLEAFDEGPYCTLFADLFSDDIGLCVPACGPTNDTVTGGAAVNNDCGAGNGCYLNATRGVAACASEPAPAAGVTQNQDCYCLEDPSDPASGVKASCLGLFHGCLSLEEQDLGLPPAP